MGIHLKHTRKIPRIVAVCNMKSLAASCRQAFFPILLRRRLQFIETGRLIYLPYQPIMFPTLPGDLVIIIRNQIVQQPGFRHHEPWAALDGAQAALGAPAGDRVGCVAGEAGDLLHGQHVGSVGQLLLQVAAEE